jgi:hypothetical protein
MDLIEQQSKFETNGSIRLPESFERSSHSGIGLNVIANMPESDVSIQSEVYLNSDRKVRQFLHASVPLAHIGPTRPLEVYFDLTCSTVNLVSTWLGQKMDGKASLSSKVLRSLELKVKV